jgi:hypothetical protein
MDVFIFVSWGAIDYLNLININKNTTSNSTETLTMITRSGENCEYSNNSENSDEIEE